MQGVKEREGAWSGSFTWDVCSLWSSSGDLVAHS